MLVLVENTDTFVALPHKLWTREECEGLERAGMLEVERYELIEGELILKMGKNLPHMRAFSVLTGWPYSVFGMLFVMPEASLDLNPEDNPTNESQPDVLVLNRSVRTLSGRPRPADLRLVAEVSDTPLSLDVNVKALLYARAGIAEYWVVDVGRRRVIVHRRPAGGRYLDVAGYSENETVSTLAAPEASIRVGELF